MSSVPVRCNDWVPRNDDLDEMWAWRTLDQLSDEDMLRLLDGNPSTVTEALSYAKGLCFSHYLGVLLDYLLSDRAKENFAAAGAFLELLVKKKPEPDAIVGRRQISMREGARLVAERQAFYGADEDIWGSFARLYEQYVNGEN